MTPVKTMEATRVSKKEDREEKMMLKQTTTRKPMEHLKQFKKAQATPRIMQPTREMKATRMVESKKTCMKRSTKLSRTRILKM